MEKLTCKLVKLALVVVCTWALSGAALASATFSTDEFPNYLMLDEQYRNLNVDQVPEKALEKSIALWSKALQSLYNRLDVPIVVDGKAQMVRYFSHLNTELKKIDPDVEVLPSGGVVRSALAHLYSLVHKKMQRHTSTVEQALTDIINDPTSVEAMDIRGVASDFDVLLTGHNPRKTYRLRTAGVKITESPEVTHGARHIRNEKKRAVYMVPDFKNYDEQTNRSTSQGGSEIDFLSFNISKGEFVEPEKYPGIVKRLFAGRYRYLQPDKAESVEDADKQTIRGIRPLVELPFLQLEDEAILRQELLSTITKVNSGEELSKKTMQQFSKIVRNSRFSGANNRFYRGSLGSLEIIVHKLIIALKTKKLGSVIPEFVDNFELGRGSENPLPGNLLMPMSQFVEEYTDNGLLYHGTPDFMMGLAIMRGGMFVSGGANQQGRSIKGRGGYTSKRIGTARSWARNSGLVIRLSVNQRQPIRVLDWKKAEDSVEIKTIASKNPNRDIFEVLARDYGVDIIINNYVLLQNINAVTPPQTMRDVILMMHESLVRTLGIDHKYRSLVHQKLTAYNEYRSYHNYAVSLGLSNLPDLPDMTFLAEEALKKLKRLDRRTHMLKLVYLTQLIQVCAAIDCSEIIDLLPRVELVVKSYHSEIIRTEIKYPALSVNRYQNMLKALQFYRELGLEYSNYVDIGDRLMSSIRNSDKIDKSKSYMLDKTRETQRQLIAEFTSNKDECSKSILP